MSLFGWEVVLLVGLATAGGVTLIATLGGLFRATDDDTPPRRRDG